MVVTYSHSIETFVFEGTFPNIYRNWANYQCFMRDVLVNTQCVICTNREAKPDTVATLFTTRNCVKFNLRRFFSTKSSTWVWYVSDWCIIRNTCKLQLIEDNLTGLKHHKNKNENQQVSGVKKNIFTCHAQFFVQRRGAFLHLRERLCLLYDYSVRRFCLLFIITTKVKFTAYSSWLSESVYFGWQG